MIVMFLIVFMMLILLDLVIATRLYHAYKMTDERLRMQISVLRDELATYDRTISNRVESIITGAMAKKSASRRSSRKETTKVDKHPARK